MFIAFGKNHQIVLPNLALTSMVPTHVNDMRLAPDLNGRPVFFTSEGYKVDAGHFGGAVTLKPQTGHFQQAISRPGPPALNVTAWVSPGKSGEPQT